MIGDLSPLLRRLGLIIDVEVTDVAQLAGLTALSATLVIPGLDNPIVSQPAISCSVDGPSFTSGDRSPGAGLLVIAITPALLAPDFPQRLRLQLDRLASLGVHIPGRRAAATEIELPEALVTEIERAGAA